MSEPQQPDGYIAIYRASGHGRVVADAIERAATWRIRGWIDDAMTGEVFGYPVLGTGDELVRLAAEGAFKAVVIAIGDNWTRARVADRVRADAPDLRLPGVVHPGAMLAREVEIGAGSVIFAGVVVNPGTRIGPGAVLNTAGLVDHDCVIGEFASLAPGATLGGGGTIGARTAVSLGASIVHGLTIAEDSVVGAGAVVTRDFAARVVGYGIPCRVVRSRRSDEPYL